MIKLKVKPEGREGIYIAEKEDLKSFIKERNFKTIHNFIPASMMMLGADHDVESVLEDISNSKRIGILTGKAYLNNMRHALALISGDNEKEKMEMYDIGDMEKRLETKE